jgi:hypothetical protein
MNARILIEHLTLRHNGHAKITESQFKKASTTLPSQAISSNFKQLKSSPTAIMEKSLSSEVTASQYGDYK